MFNAAARRRILDEIVQQSAAELESDIKLKILESTPSGRTYRRGKLKRSGARNVLVRGLLGNKGKSRKVNLAAGFHRASTPEAWSTPCELGGPAI